MPNSKYAAEAQAVCDAYPGCEPSWLESVTIYELSDPEEMHELCQNDGALACFCGGEHGCQVMYLKQWSGGRRDGSAVHEYVHAVLDAAGVVEADAHGPVFERTYTAAKLLFKAAGQKFETR